MTDKEAVAWCAEHRAQVWFLTEKEKADRQDSAAVAVFVTDERCLPEDNSSYGDGDTFVEAVENCVAYLKRVIEARNRGKAT